MVQDTDRYIHTDSTCAVWSCPLSARAIAWAAASAVRCRPRAIVALLLRKVMAAMADGGMSVR